ncbi:MAG: ferrous iron transporter B [Ruminococcaceae bacterium]|nr:ferrous iron transporter B [Oscillospiraceae bacterium]
MNRMAEVERPGPQGRIVALAGNPNVGKSTLFNALTGLHQHTGNWPGKTVAVAQGEYVHRERRFLLIDLPGTYSMNAHSAEEEITRDFLQSGQADATVVVCDATCLERSLIFALQVMEQTKNVVLCVNLLDEARSRGMQIDLAQLARLLRVPVVGTCAGRGEGLEELMDEVEYISHPASDHGIPREACTQEERVREAERCVAMAVTCRKEDPLAGQRRIDRLLTSKKTGIPLMLLLLGGILWLTIVASNIPSQILSDSLFAAGETVRDALHAAGAPAWLTGVLIDGVYRVLAWVVSVMLPPMAIFFPLFTLLEDLGYLPRVAFVLDHAFHRAGACGKQSLTMCQGLGCNACGVTGCRIIDSPRERLLAIVTNSLVPCNGRFPTLIALITIFFLGNAQGAWSGVLAAAMLLGVLVLGVGMTLAVSRVLSATVLRGVPSSFALELPPYRRPQVGQVVVRSVLDRTLFVLGRAVAVAAPAGLVIWLCANVSVGSETILSHITAALDPVGRLMGMDGVILMAFILGWPANEIVVPIVLMAYLSQGTLVEAGELDTMGQLLRENGWTELTALCTILFSLFHWPCSTTCLTVAKETGSAKWTALAVVVPTLVGVCLCTLVATVGKMLL